MTFMNEISVTNKSKAGYKAKGFGSPAVQIQDLFRVETHGQGLTISTYAHSGHSTKLSSWSVIYWDAQADNTELAREGN